MKLKLILIAITTLLLAGCANLSLEHVYQAPSFKYQSTGINKLDFNALNAHSVVKIHNPNPYQLPISGLGAQLWLEGEPWLDLDSSSINSLPARSSVAVNFQWALVFEQLLSRAENVYQTGIAEFTLKLAPKINVPLLGPQAVNWTSSFSVAIPKLPKVSLNNFSLQNVSFTQVSLALDIAVDNPNAFAVNTQGWQLSVGNPSKPLATLKLADAALTPTSTSVHNVNLSLSLMDVGLEMMTALKSGKWPKSLALNWQGKWASPDLDFSLPDLAGKL